MEYTFAVQGSPSVIIASGQTATYMLQLSPASGSTGPVAFACTAAPADSTCTVNPASLQLTSGVTASVTVTIATIAAARLTGGSQPGGPIFLAAGAFPIGVLFFLTRRIRGRRCPSVALLVIGPVVLAPVVIALVCLGCGVTSTAGSSSPPTNGTGGGTMPATYSPVITATSPGVAQSVTLTLIVD
jgi:hypothetical protein